ncbi:MAG: N-6 DNA methylase [Syntrophales bacterium]
MTVPSSILELIARFERNRETYNSAPYNETQLRREFIDPFFKALGWDTDNSLGYAEAYKDVIHEDAIRVGGATKAPDYCFRIGGARKFFLEAKKPAVNIMEDPASAYQLRRYAWSAKLPLSILTNFESFAVYDCRIKPDSADKPSTARIMHLNWREYAARWEEIAAVFSKDSVLKGSFDKYAESSKGKKGTAEVDAAFLQEIESWRDILARNIALRNTALSQRELNTAVTMTINRIIFLRICEDRGIEHYGQLHGLMNGPNTYQRLIQIFYAADDKYNSGLFHFRPEKGRVEPPDHLTLNLSIDDKPLKDLLKDMYFPDSPYEFSVLPADILGSVYEQFLGKVIRLTPGHQAKVEDKPEVKKAGGVFYTPKYIVDAIVEKTIGGWMGARAASIGGRSQKARTLMPRHIGDLHILDPACGSGSFLIQAYQYLLNWHLRWYTENDPIKWARGKNPAIYQTASGEWRLTTSQKKGLLLNHIFGVDIDPQAVEVTKLSLLLKVLEGENEETISNQLVLLHERALPDLSANIKCGNSLIGPDFYEGRQGSLLDSNEEYRINAFDWRREFPQVFSPASTPAASEKGLPLKTPPLQESSGGNGVTAGFDVIIGNPPYIRIQTLKEWAPVEVEHYKLAYAAAGKGNYDIYVVFVEKGLSLLNANGRLGFILPHKFFNAQYGEPLRALLANGKHLNEVIHFGDRQVFAGATTYTCLLFLDKQATSACRVTKVDKLEDWQRTGAGTTGDIPAAAVTASEWNFTVGQGTGLFERLRRMPLKLEDVSMRIFQGIKTSADKIYILEEREREQGESGRVLVYSREKGTEYWLEPDLLHPLIKGGDSRRYHLTKTNRLILFPYGQSENGKASLISASIFKSRYPLTWTYLTANKIYLENREDGKMRNDQWYGYVYPKALDVMPLAKIFTPDIAARSSFSLDETGETFFTGGVAGGYGILVSENHSRSYILGLLNCHLLEWFLHRTAGQMRGGYYSYEARFIRNLPIRPIDFSDPTDIARHDRIVTLVEAMLNLNKQLATARTPHEETILKRQIETTDRQIDRLVYELYDLTEEEMAIVEGK